MVVSEAVEDEDEDVEEVLATDSANRSVVAPPAARPPWRGLAALGFVAVSLVALVVVPAYYGGQVVASQARTTNVLDPAARSSSSLTLLLTQQMARMDGYLLTGERAPFREPYMAALPDKDEQLQELLDLARELDVDLRDEVFERVALLVTDWARWDFDNTRAFDDPPDDETRAQIREQQRQLQQATRELDRTILSAVEQGQRDMARDRRSQNRITFALALVALFGTVIIGSIGYRYSYLTLERETGRREAVRARREIDSLLEATGDGVLGIDLDGKCISLNRAGVHLLGYPEGEIRGRDVHDTLFHSWPDGTPNPRGGSLVLKALFEGASLDSGDVDVLWRRKRIPFPARWSLRPLVDGVELRGAVLTFTDMTEIREKEEALHRAVQQREDVVSIVSHDLRNPLGVVLAAGDLLLDLPLDDDQRRRQAEIIVRSGRRMQTLIEDLLDVARIEAGVLVVRPSLEELLPILQEAADLFRDQAEGKRIELVVEAGAGKLAARVDRDRIMQALANLLDNAVRHTDEDGRIAMCVEDVGSELAVSVSDNGPGIASEMLDHLFDRFSQSTDTGRGGAGLGLAIVEGVAEAHGGTVRVDSQVGKGSTFTLVLPKVGPQVGEERVHAD